MSNPVVLTSGALAGIDRATALAFAREKARVVFSSRRDKADRRSLLSDCGMSGRSHDLYLPVADLYAGCCRLMRSRNGFDPPQAHINLAATKPLPE